MARTFELVRSAPHLPISSFRGQPRTCVPKKRGTHSGLRREFCEVRATAVRYSFIKIGMKLSLFIPKPLSSQNHVHQKPLHHKPFSYKPFSFKSNFTQNHFHQNPISSNFIQNHFHEKPHSSTITHCQKPFSSKNHPRQYQSYSMFIVISQPSTVFFHPTPQTPKRLNCS